MRRFVVNTLAVVGALTLLGILAGFVERRVRGDEFGVVMGPDERPLAHVPVFLDRGHGKIERYLTDPAGRIRFSLADRDVGAAVWLICAPGGIPFVDRQDTHERTSVTYQYARSNAPTPEYRVWGWRGPIPRECPPGELDPTGWSFRVPGRAGLAFSVQEPNWLP